MSSVSALFAFPFPHLHDLNRGRRIGLFWDSVCSALFTAFGALVYWIFDIGIDLLLWIIGTSILAFLISATLNYKNQYSLALGFYFTTGFASLISIHWILPSMQFEYLFYLSVGITGIMYIPRQRLAVGVFCLAILFGLITATFEIAINTAPIPESYLLPNKFVVLFGTIFVALRILMLVFINYRIIQARKNREKVISESEKRYRNVFQYSHQGIVLYDIQGGRVVDCNQQAMEIFGYESKEAFFALSNREATADIQLNGETAEVYLARKAERIFKREVFKETFIGVKADGGTFICEETIIPDFEEGKQQVLLFLDDITTSYRARKEIQDRKVLYQALIDNSFDGIDINHITHFDEEKLLMQGRLVERNEAMKAYFGEAYEPFISKESILSKSPPQQLNGVSSRRYLTNLVDELRLEGSVAYDWRVIHPGGKIYDLEISAQLIRLANRTILVRIARDVTQKRRQEALIQRQLKDLNKKNVELHRYIESNMQLENFAALASHDLKSPLRTLIGFTELLHRSLGEKITPKEEQFFGFIQSSAFSMQELINDLLQFSTVNGTKLSLESIDLRALIEEVISDLQVSIHEKQAKIDLHSLPLDLIADRIKLRQLFQNLLANAIKFSQPGITPEIHLYAKEEPNSWQIYVADNGIGIHPNFHEKIFLIFNKLHPKAQFDGTGIGLALCKKIIEQHQGSIRVESEPGHGATFRLDLPKDLASYENGSLSSLPEKLDISPN